MPAGGGAAAGAAFAAVSQPRAISAAEKIGCEAQSGPCGALLPAPAGLRRFFMTMAVEVSMPTPPSFLRFSGS